MKSLLVFAVVFLTGGCGSREAQKAQQGGPEVKVMTVRTERVELTRELPGRIVAARVSDIRPQVNGLILKRAFEEGAFVKEGDLLYQVDPAPYKAAFDQAKAALAMAEAKLPAACSQEERFKELVACRAVGQQDYDNALAARRQAEAQLEVSRAALESARINLAYTPIKAPISGRIGRSAVTEGAMVTAYQPVALATIQQLDPIYVDVPQSTSELLKLKKAVAEGKYSSDSDGLNKVAILHEDGSRYPKEGKLEFREVSVNPETGTVMVRIMVPNPDGILLPGMFVRAIVKEGVLDKAILVTQTAVNRDPKGDPYVFVVDADGKAMVRPITVDRAIGNRWLAASGLAEGDRVIIEGLQRVRNGVPVTVAGQSRGTD